MGPEFEMWYSASSLLDLVTFSDADFAGCGIDRKSTSGTCYFLRSSLIADLLESTVLLHSPPPRLSM
jgi:hypothetical protein